MEIPGQFDDPNITLSNIQNGLKNIGIQFDDGLAKLKQPYGESILALLNALADKLLVSRAHVFQQISLQPQNAEEMELISMDDLIRDPESVDEIEEFLEEDEPIKPQNTLHNKHEQPSAVDINRWKMELERVTPYLKVILSSDNKDWRVHLQQLEALEQVIEKDAEQAKIKLNTLAEQIEGTIEKIGSREKYVNTQLEHLANEYKSKNQALAQKKLAISELDETISLQSNELSRITEELELIQAQMDDLGTGMNDPKPLVQIKQAKSQLEQEMKEMDLKILTLRHEKTHKQLKFQNALLQLKSATSFQQNNTNTPREFFGTSFNKEKRRKDDEGSEEKVVKKKKRLQRGIDIIEPEHVKKEPAKVIASSTEPSPVKQSMKPKKLDQQKISKFFSASSSSKPKVTEQLVDQQAKTEAVVKGEPVEKKKFKRSEKVMVKKKEMKGDSVVEFDDDDDFDVAFEKMPTGSNEMIEIDIEQPKKEKESKLKQPSPAKRISPKKEKESKLKQPSPAKRISPKKEKDAVVEMEFEKNVSVEKEDLKEKPKKGFRSFISRGGPIAPGSKPLPVGQPNCLQGMSFVFTGELDSTSREDAADLVKRYGGRVVSAPSSKTSYLVVGREPGESKLKKAENLGIKTVDEDGFFELIETTPGQVEKSQPAVPSKKATNVKHTAKATPKPVGSEVAAVDNPSSLSNLWTVKYAPVNRQQMIGNKGHIETLSRWLTGWNKSVHSGFKGSSGRKDDPSNFRAVLISGPPGIGKTTAAHIVAEECGYQVIELNASDARNKKSIDNTVKDIIGNHCIGEYFRKKTNSEAALKKNHLVVMDEVDGMGGGDRGGMAELIQMIKKTKVPIICICNDRQSTKVRSLANYCLDLRFSRPSAQMIRSRIMQIARVEGLKVDENALDQLVASTQSDIRQILNILQTWNLCNSSMNFDESKNISQISKKNVDLGPFDLAGRMFSGSAFRGMSMDDKLGLYFADYQLMPPFVQENYIRMKPWGKPDQSPQESQCNVLGDLAAASDLISEGDLIDKLIFGQQEFSLMPVHAMFSCVMPATVMQGHMGERLQFPSILGQISKSNKSWRILKELHMHVNLHISGDKNELRQSYFPLLMQRVCLPLVTNGVEAIPQVIRTMDDYYITREDWDTFFELSLGQEQLLKKIPTNVKTAFTRAYNKAIHNSPFAISAKPTKVSSAPKLKGVDFEEALDQDDDVGDDEEGQEKEDDSDKMIKQKVQKKTAASSSKGTKATAKKKK